MMRMLPAFGIGGVANLKMRQYYFGNLNANQWKLYIYINIIHL